MQATSCGNIGGFFSWFLPSKTNSKLMQDKGEYEFNPGFFLRNTQSNESGQASETTRPERDSAGYTPRKAYKLGSKV